MAKRKPKRRSEERIDKVSNLKRSTWKDFLLRFVRADDWSIPLALFVGSRLAIWLIPLLFRGLIPVQENQTLVDIFLRWDAGWYAGIAKDGYHWAGPDTQSSVAFFPLYPLLSRILNHSSLKFWQVLRNGVSSSYDRGTDHHHGTGG